MRTCANASKLHGSPMGKPAGDVSFALLPFFFDDDLFLPVMVAVVARFELAGRAP